MSRLKYSLLIGSWIGALGSWIRGRSSLIGLLCKAFMFEAARIAAKFKSKKGF